MKYLFSLLLCFTFLVSQAQNEPKQMPDFDELDLEGLNLDELDLSGLDLNSIFGMLDSLPLDLSNLDQLDLGQLDLNSVFGMLDSLPIDLNNLGNLEELFSDELGGLSENKDLLNDLLQQGMKTFEQMDMSEIEGLMENFMKDFEGLDLDGMIDKEEMEKIVEEHKVKKKKI